MRSLIRPVCIIGYPKRISKKNHKNSASCLKCHVKGLSSELISLVLFKTDNQTRLASLLFPLLWKANLSVLTLVWFLFQKVAINKTFGVTFPTIKLMKRSFVFRIVPFTTRSVTERYQYAFLAGPEYYNIHRVLLKKGSFINHVDS